MSSKFAGVTFDEQAATPSDDAIIRRAILDDGILNGCEFSYTGSTLTMTAGQLMICGRQVKHPSTQNWAVADATTGFARLLLTIDLTRTSSKDTFEQVVDTIEYASAVDGFPELVQDDINASGTKYQIVAAVVSLASGGISGIVSQLGQTSVTIGDKSILIVSVPAGSTVTATLGPQIKTAQEKNGEAWLRNLDVGEWNLKLTLGDQSATAKYNIERFGVYRTSMAFFAATIQITYTAGSTCTCSKGDRVYTAPDTTGKWDCVVDSAGEWKVQITADGEEPVSETVTITDDGQTVSVTLDYKLWLIRDGTENPLLIVDDSLITTTQEDGYIVYQGRKSGYHFAHLENIDTTKYSKLQYVGPGNENGNDCLIGLWEQSRDEGFTDTHALAYANVRGSVTSKTVDISNVNTICKAGAVVVANIQKLYIKSLYLER